MQTLGLNLQNQQPTRQTARSKTCIDLVFANKPVTTKTKMNQITDHDTIETIIEDLDIHKEKEKAREIRN